MGTATTYSTARSVAGRGTSCVLSDCVHNLSRGGVIAWHCRHDVLSHLDVALARYLRQNTVPIDAYVLPGGHTLRG